MAMQKSFESVEKNEIILKDDLFFLFFNCLVLHHT